METNTPRARDIENPSTTTTSPGNGSTSNNTAGTLPTPLPAVPLSTRSEPSSPYPTTFVQADTTNFKQVVQMLTGSSETTKTSSTALKPAPAPSDPPSCKGFAPPIQKKQGFKLYERRGSLKNGLTISPLTSSPGFRLNSVGFSPRTTAEVVVEMLSPSLLDFPKLALSPVTPLIEDPFNRSSPSMGSASSSSSYEVTRAMAITEKGFYFHPSPRTEVSAPVPQLLPLFPVTSPRVSASAAGSSS